MLLQLLFLALQLWFPLFPGSFFGRGSMLFMLVQIPFALIPLLCLVSKEEVMGIFKIGHVLKMISWLVAGWQPALVIVINGYLLLEFCYSEVI
ncbi:hypothetical protein U1Q18_024110 [Sarracenia purpurea var. burkii]